MAEDPARPARVLTWAADGDGGMVVLSPAVLSVGTADGTWSHVGWHEIERGGWNAETEQLRWQTYAGARGAVGLPAADKVPEVFRERVAASLVLERFIPAAPGSDRGVVVSARRDLAARPTAGAPHPAISWHTTLTRGVTWRTPGLRELADAAVARLRDEYDDR